jgi:hypothetical protein
MKEVQGGGFHGQSREDGKESFGISATDTIICRGLQLRWKSVCPSKEEMTHCTKNGRFAISFGSDYVLQYRLGGALFFCISSAGGRISIAVQSHSGRPPKDFVI